VRTSATRNLAAQRLRSQHLAKPDFGSAADVVRWFGAVQAQDFLGAMYAIGLRMRSATESSVEQSVRDGSIVRTWPMRGTLHFVPPEDARWMLKLSEERQIARARPYRERAGVTPEILRGAGRVLEQVLRDGRTMTRAEVYHELDAARLDSGGGRGFYYLKYWAQRGLICLGPRRGKQHTVALLEHWAPRSRKLGRDEGLAELATRYFTSHGPASTQDFAWWGGLGASEARRAVESVRQKLLSESVGGRDYWMTSEAIPAARRRGKAHLLPAYDEFTVAYADRGAVIAAAHLRKAGFGIGPVIIIDGRIVGGWKRRLAKAVVVDLKFLEKPAAGQTSAAAQATRRYAEFIGLPLRRAG
jgi:hypothetical protein